METTAKFADSNLQVVRAEDLARLNLIGESPAFKESINLIQRIACCDATTLIQGETGTGKELAARAIHYLGNRRTSPFIPVNCGAIPETLVENELFGHAKGAFTDAREARAGVIAQANGGTLFLDEIEAMGMRAQVALLRFLQDREYRPVGGTLVRDADVRVVAASNADLDALCQKGVFRHDLLYRLNVLALRLPPLREREGDAVLLTRSFLQRLSKQYQKPIRALHPETLAFLRTYHWPGNVRELENLIQREFLLSDGPLIHLGATAGPSRSEAAGGPPAIKQLTATAFKQAKARAIAEFERAYIVELLARTDGNISLAARVSGKERSRLGKMVKKYGLRRESP